MTQLVQLITLFICLLSGSVPSAHAGTPVSDRIAVEAGVKAELSKDLALPYAPDAALFRQNLSGRQADKRISGRHHGILGQPGMVRCVSL